MQIGKFQKANHVGEEALKDFEKEFDAKHEYVIMLQIINASILTKMEKY